MSDIESIKSSSNGLRGTLADDLSQDTASFGRDNKHLLKFHGAYQEDDRDVRQDRRKAGLEPAHIIMVRCKLPGGQLTAEQYLVLDRLADEAGNGTLRITTRQGIQFHGVLKQNVRELIATLNRSGITTWGACGDVVRNVVATPVPGAAPAYDQAQSLARELSRAMAAESSAYLEVWLGEEQLNLTDGSTLPRPHACGGTSLYGTTFLPRKFKIGIALPPSNDVDVYTHDLGLAAHWPNGSIDGYTLVVGGGMGMTFGKADTFPMLAQPLGYVDAAHVIEASRAVVAVFRDHGNRTSRKHARLKYVIHEKGIEWFREKVNELLSVPLQPPRDLSFNSVADPLGWHARGDGRFFYGLHIPSGRIGEAYKTVLRHLAEQLRCPIRLTTNQNLLLADLPAEAKSTIESSLLAAEIELPSQLTEARKVSLACVALPTCNLAVCESERVFGGVMEKIDSVLTRLNLRDEQLIIRMTGCANGCARPYNADIAFVGRNPGKYALYAGGSATRNRLAREIEATVPLEELHLRVESLLEDFVANRQSSESFSDYCQRTEFAACVAGMITHKGRERNAEAAQNFAR